MNQRNLPTYTRIDIIKCIFPYEKARIKMIDIHTHVGPYHHKHGGDKSVPLTEHQNNIFNGADLLQLMSDYDIKESVMFPFPWVNEPREDSDVARYQEETAYILNLANQHPQLIPCPIFDPTDIKSIRLYEKMVSGDKIVDFQGLDCASFKCFKI